MKLGLITRYLNEPFLDEFIEYYFSEGVNNIFILYDVDSVLPISDNVKQNKHVTILNSVNFKEKQMHDVNVLYNNICDQYTWIIFIDCDEFISCKGEQTIRNALHNDLKNVDCIKIPWVMMSSGGRKENPTSLLQELTTRWNHNLTHPHPHNWTKGRCRYDAIEVKSIVRCSKFKSLGLHHPSYPKGQYSCIESVDCKPSALDPFFMNFHEYHIERAFMLCYHYRIYSLESAKRKLEKNKLLGYQGKNVLQYLIESDYSEKDELFMRNKSIMRFGYKNKVS